MPKVVLIIVTVLYGIASAQMTSLTSGPTGEVLNTSWFLGRIAILRILVTKLTRLPLFSVISITFVIFYMSAKVKTLVRAPLVICVIRLEELAKLSLTVVLRYFFLNCTVGL